MELEELKQQWRQTGELQKTNNQNIMELMQQKSYGPLAALKRSFRKQMTAMIVVPLAMLATNMNHIDKTLSSALFWFYILFCIGVILFARRNYALVQKMEDMDGAVKSNLEQQIRLLETRVKQNRYGVRIALLFFVVLTEVLPYFQYFSMLHKWHSLSPWIRFGAYAGLFLLQFGLSHVVSHRKYGRHIDYLKELVQQMQ